MENKIKVFEMFAGYGGASFALKKANIPHKVVGYSEIDKFAVQCYEQNHGNIKNWGDCTTIDPNELPDFDLLTGGFPCQAFSVAGKGKGVEDPRGQLFQHIIRIAEVKKPKYMLLENVKGLLSKKHKDFYNYTIQELNRIGYEVFMVYDKKKKRNIIPTLNSRDYGIPQNRERVWYICFREYEDITNFKLPEKEELKIFLKDILEHQVDKKYYLSEKVIERILGRWQGKIDELISKTITAQNNYKCGRQTNIIQVNNPKHSNDRVYSLNGISPTLNTMQGGHRQPFIVASRGRNPENPSDRTPGKHTEQRLEPKFGGITNCLSTIQKDNYVLNDSKIRKLTPKECFRLMGFLDDQINLEGLSNTQKYKLAGNGWDINLVSQIFTQMFKEEK
jgi:DNA (cytosine-5)-methyltransferase 1